MGIFLGFRQPELAQAMAGDPSAQRVHDFRLGIDRRHEAAVMLGIIRHSHQRRPVGPRAGIKGVEGRIAQRGHDLPRPIRAKVEAEKPVAVRCACVVADNGRRYEFVGFVTGIGPAHGLVRRIRARALARENSGGGLGDAVPAGIAVHREIAARHRCDAYPLGQSLLQLLKIRECGGGGHVPPVCHQMQNNWYTRRVERLRSRDHVIEVPVHAAVGYHTQQMRRAPTFNQPLRKVGEPGIDREGAFLDREVNLTQIHGHDAARADVGMAHLRVAHLAFGQARVRAVGDQRRMGAAGHDAVEIGCMGKGRGVAFRLLAQPPTIENT